MQFIFRNTSVGDTFGCYYIHIDISTLFMQNDVCTMLIISI